MSPTQPPGQQPVAIVGFACRLPGGNMSPSSLWDFLEEGRVADNHVPASRFTLAGHHDGSQKPGTMRPPGGMFLDDASVDLTRLDAGFFEISGTEAIAMDPNQRQTLEVVYEALENCGVPLQAVDGRRVACYVGSFACDYGDAQNRDPENRPANNAIGVGRAILANRISYFLNIRGPSVTIDTACSGSLVALDLACGALRSGEVEMAIVATSNIYLSPEHVIDKGSGGQAHSATGFCHTFDAAADGYVKAEAVSCVIIKRLDSAIRDGDPIRAVIRGLSSNSNGRTTGGIATPSAEAQVAAIRSAYVNAGIACVDDTQYLECHGTGTQVGDPIEVGAIGTAFAATRHPDKPLIIGSIKSNVGHSEPAAGLSGLIKTVLAIENGTIPGTPLFINPNPKIDFTGYKVKASRLSIPWPDTNGKPRRASLNSFGYGGSNAHAVIEEAPSHTAKSHTKSLLSAEDALSCSDNSSSSSITPERPHVLVLSANDASSLKANIKALCNHLINPRVRVSLPDLAYTLSERRSWLWHRAFLTTDTVQDLQPSEFTLGKKRSSSPTIAFIFTGQGSQWPAMGRELLEHFPLARTILDELDAVLRRLPGDELKPDWSLLSELSEQRTAEHVRQAELSQPLVTALQLCLLGVLESWGVRPSSVIGHSSGEIAAAYAAGFLDRDAAIKAAYYRGLAAASARVRANVHACDNGDKKEDDGKDGGRSDHGMLAVGLGAEGLMSFLEKPAYVGRAWIACFNSQSSVTVSGTRAALALLAEEVKSAGHFSRLLLVDLAYHSELMNTIGDEYGRLLSMDGSFSGERCEGCPTTRTRNDVSMFSTVTALRLDTTTPTDALYWKTNMVSPVRFQEAFEAMLSQPNDTAPDILIEIGPSGTLAGPVHQMLQSHPNGDRVSYFKSWQRSSTEASKTLLDLAGHLFIQGVRPLDLAATNATATATANANPRTVVDLPNYRWNHAARYWHETAASRDWRFRRFVRHDLIGSKVAGVPWQGPAVVWRNHLRLDDVPWLRHHRMGTDVLMPGAGLATMAIEAMFQKFAAVVEPDGAGASGGGGGGAVASSNELAYRLRDVRFYRALVLEEDEEGVVVVLSLTQVGQGGRGGALGWHRFRISTSREGSDNLLVDHCSGLIRVVADASSSSSSSMAPVGADLSPLQCPQSFEPWYKAQRGIGMGFGPAFRNIKALESVAGRRSCRALVDLTPPASRWTPQSSYSPFHPAVLDGCLLVATPAKVYGERSLVHDLVVPGVLDDVFVNRVPGHLSEALSIAESRTSGLGRPDKASGTVSDLGVYDVATGTVLVQIRGLHDVELDVGRDIDSIPLTYPQWKPDISLLTQEQIARVGSGAGEICGAVRKLDVILDLMMFRNPLMKILEVNLGEGEGDDASSSVWLGNDDDGATRPSYLRCDIACSDAQVLVRMRSKHEAGQNVSFSLINTDREAFGLDTGVLYDVIIFRMPSMSQGELREIMQRSRTLVAEDSFTLIMVEAKKAALNQSQCVRKREMLRDIGYFKSLIVVEESPVVYLCQNDSIGHGNSASPNIHSTKESNHLIISSLSEAEIPGISPSLRSKLESAHWNITMAHGEPSPSTLNSTKSNAQGTILILDELVRPMLTTPSEAQWAHLQSLVACNQPLLWVTRGSQHHAVDAPVTEPDRALVHGLFRVARRESYGARLTTLDLDVVHPPGGESGACNMLSAASEDAICRVLDAMRAGTAEAEYAERDGLLSMQRVMLDIELEQLGRSKPVERGLWEDGRTRELRAERVGSLESLMWCETHPGPVRLEEGCIEVEVEAVGVNFKDVATTMGIIQGNEYMLGCECSGTVRRLGPGVTKFNEGDRVAVMKAGTYANLVQTPAERAHVIPDSMSFDEAATIPLVFMTALYGMFHLGNLQEGQTVLIHSAAGGVGLAAIQLAQLKNCTIYATAGTEEKKTFLSTTFSIPRDHIFSSHTDAFAQQIRAATAGRGVDVVLNSLTDDLLDASWRIVADGGTMVEIGKRDIADRHSLAMEPFGRNCSFRAVDLSYGRHITDALVGRLLADIFDLVRGGRVGPVRPTTLYGFDEVGEALAFMRRGRHIGKLVVSRSVNERRPVRVPVKPVPPVLKLRPDVAYLLVGGLKGLCGSLAAHMARSGARHIIVCCRSGIQDPASRRVERDCRSYGCHVSEAKGDITDMEFVESIFKRPYPGPIAGIVQGAMVLRDTPYETMSVTDYRLAIDVKVQGTWNLHHASLRLSTQPLDFFTLLSSLSGVAGNKGQANYAAAGTFLDAFAHHRHSLGQRAHALDLGVVDDVGYVAEQGEARGLEKKFGQGQWTRLSERALRRVFDYSVLQQQVDGVPVLSRASAAQLVTGLPVPLDESSDLAADARFRHLLLATDATTRRRGEEGEEDGARFGRGGDDDAALQELHVLRASPETTTTMRQALVLACVRVLAAQVSRLLRLETELEPDKQLASYGLDSLSAIELRGWLRARLSVDLSALDITNAPSLTSLAEKIVRRFSS